MPLHEVEKNIVGIIPAAGRGSRLYPYPGAKELFPVGFQDICVKNQIEKRPKVISQYLIENIVKAGAKRLFVIIGEGKHDIMSYYGDGHRFGVEIVYLFQEDLYGMPFAINLAKNLVKDSTVIFGMPDTIIEPNDVFLRLVNFHFSKKSDLTLGLFRTDNAEKFGMVDIDEKNKVTYIIDKPKETSLEYMWGCACWSASFSNLLDEYLEVHPYFGKEIVLGDVFTSAIENGLLVRGFIFDDGQYIDIGTADELNAALKKFHL